MSKLSASVPVVATCLEHELLLCCVRTHIDAKEVEHLRTLLHKDIDWAYLLQAATWHKIMPLLYWSIKNSCPEAVPEKILAQLHNYFQRNAQRNLFQTRELLKLLNLLQAHEIRVIPYKGVTLAVSVYGNLALRQIGDLDILVHKQDFLRTKDLLISQGYQSKIKLHWEDNFVNADGTIGVDLHQAITPNYLSCPLDFEYLWSRLEHQSFGGTTVAIVLPENLLLILCLQWGKDFCEGRERLAQLCDVAELLRVYPKLDWVWLLEQAHQLGCERMLLLVLLLANNLLGGALPEVVSNKLQTDTVVKSLAAQVCSQLWCKDKDVPTPQEESFLSLFLSYKHRFHFKMRERLQDRIIDYFYWLRLLLYMALTPNDEDFKFLSLPKVLFFLYYPLHILRLVAKHGFVHIFTFTC